MNLPETARLLALVQSFNNRTVGEADVMAWHSVLDDIDAADAVEAVRLYFRASGDWLMPSRIRSIVEEIELARRRAATKWAPGQYGVPKADAMPEIAGPVAEGELTPEVRNLLASVRAMLPEGSRDALMPRATYWEREQAAYRRAQQAEPNPHYRPKPETGILPNAYRCGDCSFATASYERMVGHKNATGHAHEGEDVYEPQAAEDPEGLVEHRSDTPNTCSWPDGCPTVEECRRGCIVPASG